MIAAASDLLVLLGRLRTGMVDMQPIPLRDHVVREISTFEQKANEQGLPQEDIDVARYALAATADDIVQTIPGVDRSYWQQFSMAAELLQDRTAGIGFFVLLDQVIALPAQRRHLLELMLTCLSLGFEGKYRTEPNGAVALSRLRNEVYQRLRAAEARPGHEISMKWLPVLLGGRRRANVLPLWVICSIAAAMVVALFATFSWVLSNEVQAGQKVMLSQHNMNIPITVQPEVTQAATDDSGGLFDTEGQNFNGQRGDTQQFDDIKSVFQPEIDEGSVVVYEKGDYIAVRLASLQFRSGRETLVGDPSALIEKIAFVLNTQRGKVIIEGHSDITRLRSSNRFGSNKALSEARAQTVHDLLAKQMDDPDRMDVTGIGPDEPIDNRNTKEAYAKNRRVEVLVLKEQRF